MRHTTAPHTEDRAAAGLLAAPPPALRLLVTNPWNGQAYCVLRALRPYAARVIATAYREHGLLGRLAPGAVSRFVDGVYPVPFAAHDWQRGRIRDENSESEEAYVEAILDICAREDIDTVFPSWDPEVGILSKNKSRFAARGITVPVPEWPVLRQAMDKHALAELAAGDRMPEPAEVPSADPGRRRRAGGARGVSSSSTAGRATGSGAASRRARTSRGSASRSSGVS